MVTQAQYVTRAFELQAQDSLAAAADSLQTIGAVKMVRMLPKKHAIEAEYDQCQISYPLLCDHLRQQGFVLKAGWLDRLRVQWFDYLDTTARENAAAPPPACCNKPPKQH